VKKWPGVCGHPVQHAEETEPSHHPLHRFALGPAADRVASVPNHALPPLP
ncbi:hypothetical protein NDU88_000903, partial [Pleurodeles waltl]